MSIDRETIDRLLAEQDGKQKTLQQLKKYFGTEMDKCIVQTIGRCHCGSIFL